MAKPSLKEKIGKLESQTQRQSEKVSLLLEQVENLTKQNQRLLLLVEEFLYESEQSKSGDHITESIRIIEEPKATIEESSGVYGKALRSAIHDKLIFN